MSLEQFGVPSTFVLRADAFEEAKKMKVKEALCYLGMTKYMLWRRLRLRSCISSRTDRRHGIYNGRPTN